MHSNIDITEHLGSRVEPCLSKQACVTGAVTSLLGRNLNSNHPMWLIVICTSIWMSDPARSTCSMMVPIS